MTAMKTISTACRRYLDHAEDIISHETERKYALAQAKKCERRLDCKGAQEWRKQAHKFALASMRESTKAGIIGNAKHAGKISSVELIGRMGS